MKILCLCRKCLFYHLDTSVLLEDSVHPEPKWVIFHHVTREFINEVISVISL